jgi:proteasome lid subunit RPN8/RPN11
MVQMSNLKQITRLSISDGTVRDLKNMALGGYPYEICGLIHPHNIIHQYPNTFCGNRELGFDMEVDIHDDQIKAIWHSHPGGLTMPSRDDIPCMQRLAAHGYNYPWIIVTAKEVTEWIFDTDQLSAK